VMYTSDLWAASPTLVPEREIMTAWNKLMYQVLSGRGCYVNICLRTLFCEVGAEGSNTVLMNFRQWWQFMTIIYFKLCFALTFEHGVAHLSCSSDGSPESHKSPDAEWLPLTHFVAFTCRQ
jgi:hypothetical protein